MRRTKILVTLGPASNSPSGISSLLRAGVDGVRVNFSHGTGSENRATLERVHRAARAQRREIGVVADLQGPKIRIGPLKAGSVELRTGELWRFDDDPAEGNGERVHVAPASVLRAARPGLAILLGDGATRLLVEHASPGQVDARVVHGGEVRSNAGLFLPGADLRTSVLGPKDLRDLDIAVEAGVDFIALSFVRDAEDVRKARRALDRRSRGSAVGIIAKIERAEALAHAAAIVAESDGIMVARGDLGIEVPLERLALEQKALVHLARGAGRFSIVATQMLLSMVSNPSPTRAEATDVANAVLDGADVLMLSEESAVGRYPLESVRWLERIAEATEPSIALPGPTEPAASPASALESAVARAAVDLARDTRATAIVTPTHSGRTARRVAALRPAVPVVAIAPVAEVRRQLALVWGVQASPIRADLPLETLRTAAQSAAVRWADARAGDPVVVTAGYPITGSPTNLVTVLTVPGAPPPKRSPGGRRPRASGLPK